MALLCCMLLAGCTAIGWPHATPQNDGPPKDATMSRLPPTLGEQTTDYGYIPVDGLAVEQTLEDDTCYKWRAFTNKKSPFSTPSELSGVKAGVDPFRPLLETLPDISVRFAVAGFSSSGGLAFGPSKITVKGDRYKAVLDYVNVDAIPVDFLISALVGGKRIRLSEARRPNIHIDGFDVRALPRDAAASEIRANITTVPDADLVAIPVYVGVGMRLTADVTALESGAQLNSLGAIGVEAELKRVSGTLTVQTIGITGDAVATSLPLPNKLDQTTIENGILAIGSNRALVYRPVVNGVGTTVTPRVVGLYSPIGSEPALVNAIYSELSRNRPKWARLCRPAV